MGAAGLPPLGERAHHRRRVRRLGHQLVTPGPHHRPAGPVVDHLEGARAPRAEVTDAEPGGQQPVAAGQCGEQLGVGGRDTPPDQLGRPPNE